LLWEAAEPLNGNTTQWLTTNSKRLGIYLGIGFIETDGDDFYNTYAIAGPDGKLTGYVRKTMAETGIFRCSTGSHTIDTGLGKIGVGICADNHFVPMVRKMQKEGVILMLMPHAWPGPSADSNQINQELILRSREKARDLACIYAKLLGVPVVFTNHVGPIGRERWMGIIGSKIDPDSTSMIGMATISDANGCLVAQADDSTETIITAELDLHPSVQRIQSEPARFGNYGGGWLDASASSNFLRDLVCYIDSFLGSMNYKISSERRHKAAEKYLSK